MSHHEARMTSKGQITIPAAVRDFFDLKPGDLVDFYVDKESRSARIRARNRPASELFGALNAYVEPGALSLTQRDIDDAIATHLAEEDERIMRDEEEWEAFREWRSTHRPAAAE